MRLQTSLPAQHGFSLLELLVTLSIFGVASVFAIPRFGELSTSFNGSRAVSEFAAEIRRARSEALSSGVRVIIASAEEGSILQSGFDYVPYTSLAQADANYQVKALPHKMTIDLTTPLIFDSRGYLINALGNPVTRTVTVSAGDVAYAVLTINPMGVININRNV